MNTIHIITDTLKRNHLGCYGSQTVKTPDLDAFAERSVVFDQVYGASFPCPEVVKRFEDDIKRWRDDVSAPAEYVNRLLG